MVRAIEPNSPEWHSARRTGVGGSDIVAILGISPYKTPLELWRLKRGLDVPDAASNEALRGQYMEPHIARRAQEHMGTEIMGPVELHRHPRWSEGVRILANTDGQIRTTSGEIAVAEFKSTYHKSRAAASAIRGGVCLSHYLQVHAYMAATESNWAIVFTAVGPLKLEDWGPDVGDLYAVAVKRCPSTTTAVEMLAERFWKRVESGVAPDWKRLGTAVSKLSRLCRYAKTCHIQPRG